MNKRIRNEIIRLLFFNSIINLFVIISCFILPKIMIELLFNGTIATIYITFIFIVILMRNENFIYIE